MTDDEVLNYVNTTAEALGLPLDAERAKNVAQHLGRTFGMVGGLKNYPLAPEQELAEIFRPAPFPDVAPAQEAA